ncbi:MAG: hypothetical protein DRN71_02770 [Candidatus Nanohalarchaeota archaeon]|nr:MAG: hypothetical protein DRN71_02770 [Candidatus Nanohaloarchaeota archaeon]
MPKNDTDITLMIKQYMLGEKGEELSSYTTKLEACNAELKVDNAGLEKEVNTQKTLLDTMTHDLRGPLTVIMGYLELLLSIPEAENHVNIAYKEVDF